MNEIVQILAQIRKEKGISQQKMAEMLDIPQRTWANYETGRSNPSLKVLLKLAEMGYSIPGLVNGGTADTTSAGQISEMSDTEKKEIQSINSSEFVIPLLDQKLSAGRGQYVPDSDTLKTFITAPAYLAKYKETLAALTVDGDSMEPTLSRGDMVVCDSCGWDGEGIYAIQMDGCGYVKRLSRRPGKLVVLSDNPVYDTWEEPADSQALRIIGRVHCVLKAVE